MRKKELDCARPGSLEASRQGQSMLSTEVTLSAVVKLLHHTTKRGSCTPFSSPSPDSPSTRHNSIILLPNAQVLLRRPASPFYTALKARDPFHTAALCPKLSQASQDIASPVVSDSWRGDPTHPRSRRVAFANVIHTPFLRSRGCGKAIDDLSDSKLTCAP